MLNKSLISRIRQSENPVLIYIVSNLVFYWSVPNRLGNKTKTFLGYLVFIILKITPVITSNTRITTNEIQQSVISWQVPSLFVFVRLKNARVQIILIIKKLILKKKKNRNKRERFHNLTVFSFVIKLFS